MDIRTTQTTGIEGCSRQLMTYQIAKGKKSGDCTFSQKQQMNVQY